MIGVNAWVDARLTTAELTNWAWIAAMGPLRTWQRRIGKVHSDHVAIRMGQPNAKDT
jgi:hypothetical protein